MYLVIHTLRRKIKYASLKYICYFTISYTWQLNLNHKSLHLESKEYIGNVIYVK